MPENQRSNSSFDCWGIYVSATSASLSIIVSRKIIFQLKASLGRAEAACNNQQNYKAAGTREREEDGAGAAENIGAAGGAVVEAEVVPGRAPGEASVEIPGMATGGDSKRVTRRGNKTGSNLCYCFQLAAFCFAPCCTLLGATRRGQARRLDRDMFSVALLQICLHILP